MSGAVLPTLGQSGSTSYDWVVVHKLASMLTLVLLAVKLVLHRAWIAAVIKRLFARENRQAQVDRRGLAYERAMALGRKRQ